MAKTKTQSGAEMETYTELTRKVDRAGMELYTELTRTKVDRAGGEIEPAKPLSGAIRRALAGTGLSSYQIAAKVGITPPAMHRFLKGERGLSLEMLDKVIVAMGLEVIVRPKSGE